MYVIKKENYIYNCNRKELPASDHALAFINSLRTAGLKRYYKTHANKQNYMIYKQEHGQQRARRYCISK